MTFVSTTKHWQFLGETSIKRAHTHLSVGCRCISHTFLSFHWFSFQIGCCPASQNCTKLPNWGRSSFFCSSLFCSSLFCSFFCSSFFAPRLFAPRFLYKGAKAGLLLLLIFLSSMQTVTINTMQCIECSCWWSSYKRCLLSWKLVFQNWWESMAKSDHNIVNTHTVICQGLVHFHNRIFGHMMCNRIHQNNVLHEIHIVA